jgi:small subunit ribosomal protein S17
MVMRETGLGTKAPKKTCEDPDCPYHGTLSVRGKTLDGIVVSIKMGGTVTVERGHLHYVKKYMRYERRRSKLLAHNPPCLELKEGDRVRIIECRPISKEVSFVAIERILPEQ